MFASLLTVFIFKKMIKVIHGECLAEMDKLIQQGIKTDIILTDLPYNQTQNSWDVIIPLDELWKRYLALIKDNGVVCLFGNGMFTARLMLSNPAMWKYNLIWDKKLPSGFLNANRQPLRTHEDICIFYSRQPTYNPQKTKGLPNHGKGKPKEYANNNYGKFKFVDNKESLGDMKHPGSILRFAKPHPSKTIHPTEKPVELLKWLISTYTNESELVLDSCCGSGSVLQAACELNRNAIGIEIRKDYFCVSQSRIKMEPELE